MTLPRRSGPRFELTVADPAGVRVARAAGADRVELCTGLALGGLTPSAGLLSASLAAAEGMGVHVLVRPRAGDFVHSEDDIAVMLADVEAARAAGAAGVVFGALDENGRLDLTTTTRLVRAAEGMETTFHRAIDASLDPVETLLELGRIGVTRVLTSGGADRAIDGTATLAALVGAGSGVQVMAGGGVRLEHLPTLIAIGVDAVHASAKTFQPARGHAPALGSALIGGLPDGHETTDAALASALISETHRFAEQVR